MIKVIKWQPTTSPHLKLTCDIRFACLPHSSQYIFHNTYWQIYRTTNVPSPTTHITDCYLPTPQNTSHKQNQSHRLSTTPYCDIMCLTFEWVMLLWWRVICSDHPHIEGAVGGFSKKRFAYEYNAVWCSGILFLVYELSKGRRQHLPVTNLYFVDVEARAAFFDDIKSNYNV